MIIQDGNGKNYKDMTLEELNGLMSNISTEFLERGGHINMVKRVGMDYLSNNFYRLVQMVENDEFGHHSWITFGGELEYWWVCVGECSAVTYDPFCNEETYSDFNTMKISELNYSYRGKGVTLGAACSDILKKLYKRLKDDQNRVIEVLSIDCYTKNSSTDTITCSLGGFDYFSGKETNENITHKKDNSAAGLFPENDRLVPI